MPSLSKSERENQNVLPNNSNIFDSPTAIFAAIVLGFAGTGVAMGMPLLVGSMASSLGFSDQQLGYLASSDMTGLFVGSVSASLVVAKMNRRLLAAAGLFMVMLGNYLSIQSHQILLPFDAVSFLCRNRCGTLLCNMHRQPCRKS